MLKCRRGGKDPIRFRLGTYDNRNAIAGLALVFSAVCLGSTAPATLAEGDTVTHARCDVGRSNFVSEDIQTPLTMVWKTTTSAVRKTTQAPLYQNGIIYFSMGKNVYAVRSADGTTLWTYSGNAMFSAPPAMSSDALFIGSDDAHLYKLSLKDGSVIWNKQLSAQLRSSPAYENGRVYVGDENGDVYSLDSTNGNVVWTFQAGGAVSSPVVLSDKHKLFFAGADSKIYCLSAGSGHQDWELLFQADLGGSPPCFANDTLYVPAGQDLYALNPNRGATRWKAHFKGQITSPPTAGPDNVFVATDDNKIEALNDRGNVLWDANIEQTTTAAPLLAKKTVVVTTDHGAMYAFDADSGSRLWDYVVQPTGTRTKPATVDLSSSPVLADNALYVLSDDGSLSAFHNQTLDQAGPVIYNVTPTPGSSVVALKLNLAATVVDEGSGISPKSLTLTVDGNPVKAVAYDAATNGMRTTVDPLAIPGPNTPSLPALKNGPHTAVMTIADWKGNVITKSWGFSITSAGAKTAAQQAVDANQTVVDTGDGPSTTVNVPGSDATPRGPAAGGGNQGGRPNAGGNNRGGNNQRGSASAVGGGGHGGASAPTTGTNPTGGGGSNPPGDGNIPAPPPPPL